MRTTCARQLQCVRLTVRRSCRQTHHVRRASQDLLNGLPGGSQRRVGTHRNARAAMRSRTDCAAVVALGCTSASNAVRPLGRAAPTPAGDLIGGLGGYPRMPAAHHVSAVWCEWNPSRSPTMEVTLSCANPAESLATVPTSRGAGGVRRCCMPQSASRPRRSHQRQPDALPTNANRGTSFRAA